MVIYIIKCMVIRHAKGYFLKPLEFGSKSCGKCIYFILHTERGLLYSFFHTWVLEIGTGGQCSHGSNLGRVIMWCIDSLVILTILSAKSTSVIISGKIARYFGDFEKIFFFFLSFKVSFCKQSVGFGEQRSKRQAIAENVVKEALK
jgi:hypothetical protein